MAAAMEFAQQLTGDLFDSAANTTFPNHAIEPATTTQGSIASDYSDAIGVAGNRRDLITIALDEMMARINAQLPFPVSSAAAAVIEQASTRPEVNRTALVAFLTFMLFRYTRTVVSIGTYNCFKPKKLAAKPKFTPEDVTVIIPTTFKTPAEQVRCIRRVLACQPFKIYVITSEDNVELIKELCMAEDWSLKEIIVLGVPALNKRSQILEALKEVETAITVFADDDVFWPTKHGNYLKYLLAIFEDDKVGAGGTRQRVRRGERPTFVDFLGICYLERRVWNNATTNAIDGSISTLSGRTAAYRTSILKHDQFYYYFMNDKWRGKPLNSDDDKCLTRYVYSNGWKIALQFDPRSTLETTVEPDWKGYIAQCLRWARAHWRGNFTVMENESYWRSFKMLWGCYVIYVGQFQTPALLWDGLNFFLLSLAVGGTQYAVGSYMAFAAWVFFTKIMKLIPHFRRHPRDTMFIPGMIIFSYLHGILNVYALFTMTTTHWGSKNIVEEAKPRVDAGQPEVVEEFVEKTVLEAETPVSFNLKKNPADRKAKSRLSEELLLSEDSGIAELQ